MFLPNVSFAVFSENTAKSETRKKFARLSARLWEYIIRPFWLTH